MLKRIRLKGLNEQENRSMTSTKCLKPRRGYMLLRVSIKTDTNIWERTSAVIFDA